MGQWAANLFISLDVHKQNIWDKLQPTLVDYFEANKAQAQQAGQTYAQALASALQKRINAHVERYQVTVDGWINEQKTELNDIFSTLNDWSSSESDAVGEELAHTTTPELDNDIAIEKSESFDFGASASDDPNDSYEDATDISF